MAEKWPHVYCALGVHPNDIFAASAPAYEDAEDAAQAPAPGEPRWKHMEQEDLTEELLREFAELSDRLTTGCETTVL